MSPRPRLPVGAWGAISTTATADGAHLASAQVRDLDGMTRRVRARGRTAAEARRRLRTVLSDRVRAAGAPVGVVRVPDLVDRWLEAVVADERYAERTLAVYRHYARVASETARGLLVTEATTRTLTAALATLADRPTTQRGVRMVLTGALAIAVREDLLRVNPLRETPVTPRKRPEPRALTEDEVRRLRILVRTWGQPRDEATGAPAPGPRNVGLLADLVDVMLTTGLRIGEALGLRWVDVRLDGDPPVLFVIGTVVVGSEGVHRQPRPKSRSSRRGVRLLPAAVAALERRRAVAVPNRHGVVPIDRPVFSTRTGGYLSPHNVRRALRSSLAGTELAWVTPHSLRRTVATRMERSAGLEAASKLLGNASVRITQAHYVQRDTTPLDPGDGLDLL